MVGYGMPRVFSRSFGGTIQKCNDPSAFGQCALHSWSTPPVGGTQPAAAAQRRP